VQKDQNKTSRQAKNKPRLLVLEEEVEVVLHVARELRVALLSVEAVQVHKRLELAQRVAAPRARLVGARDDEEGRRDDIRDDTEVEQHVRLRGASIFSRSRYDVGNAERSRLSVRFVITRRLQLEDRKHAWHSAEGPSNCKNMQPRNAQRHRIF
jgi:hypothetical protein